MAQRLLFTLALCVAAAARAEVATDYQSWTSFNAETKFDPVVPKLRAFMNVDIRFQNAPRQAANVNPAGVEEMNPNIQIILRPLIGYELRPSLKLWLGYAWTPVFFINGRRENIMEHRIFQQLSGAHTWGFFTGGYRTRIEERFRATGDNAEFRQGEGQWAFRFRQQLRGMFTPSAKGPFRFIVWDEIFIHLNETTFPSQPGLDQNRAFVGIGYKASPAILVEVGYMNQYVRRFTDRNQVNNVLLVSLNFDAEPFVVE